MPEAAVVRLSFPAKTDYLLLARLALSGLAREAPVDEELLADLKLAVTEACGNAVRHAYPEGAGEVCVVHRRRGLDRVIVEDQSRHRAG
jgi:serine/threonine-protein kinase RsbW